jgi:thiol:disulfide interchange protein DsbC
MRTTRLALAAAAALVLLPLVPRAEDAAALATLKQTLQQRFPDIKILEVQPTPAAGLFEVYTGDSIVYATATGDHLILGSMMDTRTKRNLTAQSMDVHNSIDFSSLPTAQAIKVVKGNGKRQLAVFADPDCPYCKKLEQELASVSDITVYTYLYPLANLHPDAPKKAHAIWCSANRSATWTHWMVSEEPAKPQANCNEDPLKNLLALGEKLHINSTPTLFLANGKRVSGMLTAAELEKALAASTGAAPAKTASN